MESSEQIVYEVDGEDVIRSVGGAWERFAHRNDASHLVASDVTGRSLWDFVSGQEVRELTAALLAHSRLGHVVRVGFRCDGPDCKRYLRLEIHPLDDDRLRLSTELEREEPRPTEPLLDAGTSRSEDFVRICSWCRRVEVEEEWVGVAAAVESLGLFAHDRMPALNHGICPSCFEKVIAAIEVSAPSAPGATP